MAVSESLVDMQFTKQGTGAISSWVTCTYTGRGENFIHNVLAETSVSLTRVLPSVCVC